MEIRQASSKDLLILQHIGRETYKQHFSELWSKKGIEKFLAEDFSLESLQKSLRDHQQIWFLMFDENHVVQGFAKVNLQKYQPHLNQTGTELQKFYLLNTAIEKNYSHIFFQKVLNDLKDGNSQLIYLEVLSNNIRAQKFYKKYHFKDVMTIPFSTDLYHIGMNIMMMNNL